MMNKFTVNLTMMLKSVSQNDLTDKISLGLFNISAACFNLSHETPFIQLIKPCHKLIL